MYNVKIDTKDTPNRWGDVLFLFYKEANYERYKSYT